MPLIMLRHQGGEGQYNRQKLDLANTISTKACTSAFVKLKRGIVPIQHNITKRERKSDLVNMLLCLHSPCTAASIVHRIEHDQVGDEECLMLVKKPGVDYGRQTTLRRGWTTLPPEAIGGVPMTLPMTGDFDPGTWVGGTVRKPARALQAGGDNQIIRRGTLLDGVLSRVKRGGTTRVSESPGSTRDGGCDRYHFGGGGILELGVQAISGTWAA
eukprot:758563-Hanusia_phi.AAC.2